MAKTVTRYIPIEAFAVFDGSRPFVFSPDYVHPDTGELGYLKSQLPKMSKDQMAKFRVVGGDPVKVEQATAAPGETR